MTSDRTILVHSYSGPLGGSEKILLDLLQRLDRPFALACPPGALADAAEGDAITVFRLKPRGLEARSGLRPAAAAAGLITHGREVRRLAGDLQPSLIISWGMRSAMASAATMRRLRIPIVAEHVDLLPPGGQGALARRALLQCDRVVCLSNAIARDLDPSWHASGRITVVHPGVEVPDATETSPAHPPEVLVLAALEPWKGQDLALEAAAGLPDVRLTLAGATIGGEETDYSASLRRRAAQPDLAGRVAFPGWIDSGSALQRCSLLLHSSPAEPFGRALIDALAAGRPVVAFDSAGPAEIVTPDCGRLVPVGDISGLAAAIAEITSDTRLGATMGAAGRRRVSADFEAVTQAARWQRAALSLAPRSTRPDRARVPSLSAPDVDAPGARLSLVTVIHDSAADLSRLLHSVGQHLPAAEVIVVDSGSADGGVAVASTWPGEARVLALSGNEGFGAGCVLGVAAATREVSALINPDVELVDDSLDRLSRELSGDDPPSCILSPTLIHPDGERQDAVHPIPGAAAEMVRAIVPANLLPRRIATWAEPHRADKPRRVGWAVGACLLAPTALFRDLGPFDPTVHLYGEDLDLCLRAAEAGIETWYRPDARVVHREAHSTRHAFGGEPSELLARRRRTVVGQRLGSRAQRRDDAIQLVTNADRWLLKLLSGRDRSIERQRIAALRRARKRS